MRTNLPPQNETSRSWTAQGRVTDAESAARLRLKRPRAHLFLGLLVHGLLAGALAAAVPAPLANAQTPAPQTPEAQSPAPEPTPLHRPLNRHQRPSPAKLLVVPAAAAQEPAAPAEPPKPDWPAFDKPSPASVVWDSHGLSIQAANSSLEQILKEVSTETGAKVDGLTADQRVFGSYGPGQARDVLSQLLQGSGLNVIMIGDQGQGAPKQILLSMRPTGAAQPAVRNNTSGSDEEEVEEQPEPPEQTPMRPGFPQGGAPRTPQQIEQEMEQRREQMQQQNQVPAPPPTPQY